MLVLSRRAGEAIVIGKEVRVVVLEVRGEMVRLGIAAHRLVAVHREEVFEKIREEKRRAAQSRGALDRLFGALEANHPQVGGPDPDDGGGGGLPLYGREPYPKTIRSPSTPVVTRSQKTPPLSNHRPPRYFKPA